MKYSKSFERIRRKIIVTVFGLSGLALVWLALPGAAAEGQLEVNIKTKFAEIALPAGENHPWNELFGDEITKAFAAFPQNESLTNSVGGTGSGTGIMMVSNSASSIWTIQNAAGIGMLSDPQYRNVLIALDQRDGVDVLTAPEVTTESGRQANIQAMEIGGIITGLGSGFGAGSNQVASATVGGTNLGLGPSLDVVATVSADGFSLNLKMIPSLIQLVGFDNPGGETITGTLPLPHFRLRQASLDVNVWDCQTVVIGFPAIEFPTKEKDKPSVKKALLVFVTATLINPDGTRAHSDEEIASARSSTPSQTGTNSVPKK